MEYATNDNLPAFLTLGFTGIGVLILGGGLNAIRSPPYTSIEKARERAQYIDQKIEELF